MESYIGQVMLWSGLWVPEGWTLCDGRMLDVNNQNAALYSILGTQYGGDGRKFALPKLEGVGGCRYILCVTGYYPPHP